MKAFIGFALLLCVAPAVAQSKATVALQLFVEGADAYATERNLAIHGAQENNPLARPFVTHGTPLLAGYFAADAGVKIGAEYWLTRHHHPRIARVLGVLGLADSTWAATSSFVGYRSGRSVKP
jgi:hypothetical protein